MEESILSEIIKTTSQDTASNVFSQYRAKHEIGKLIFDELIARKYSKKQNTRGFFLAENERTKIGLISQLYGLQTLALSQSFGTDILDAKDSAERVQIIGDTLAYIFTSLSYTEDVANKIIAGNFDEVSLTYNATPYLNNQDLDDESLQINSYVDTIAKVLETFVEFRTFNYHLQEQNINLSVEGFSDLVKAIDALIICSMHDLNNAAIPTKEEIPYTIDDKEIKDKLQRGCKYKGWNYVKMNNAEPSLYFTYSACSAYMALYGKFTQLITICRKAEKEMSITDLQKEVMPTIEFETNERNLRDHEFLKLAYREYLHLSKRCMDAGHYIDIMLKKNNLDITQQFVGLDFSGVNYDEILHSTTNGSLINTLLVALIFVYSGTDIDYASVGKGDDFNDRLQFSISNVGKAYKSLERINKTYIVDQYYLSFNESMPAEHQDQIKILRKQRILTLALTPLMIKAYTAVSKYITKYPQKQMKDYLITILNNRVVDKRTSAPIWIWDKDGYNVSVNMLYILDILDFYEYYEMYELPYTNDTETFNYILQQKENYFDKELDALKQKHALETQQYDKELQRLKAGIDTPHPLEKEVVATVYDYLSKHIGELMCIALTEARTDTLKQNNNNLATAFRALFCSFFSKEMIEVVGAGFIGNPTADASEDKYRQYIENENKMFNRFAYEMAKYLKNEIGNY